MADLSLNCREALTSDLPNDEHVCTGCDCTCHRKGMPADLREQFNARRREVASGKGTSR
jgi:hypothetical protein